MKRCLLTLILGGLGVLALRADPITSGDITRSFFWTDRPMETFDQLSIQGSTGGLDFLIYSYTLAPLIGVPCCGVISTFTDQVTTINGFFLPVSSCCTTVVGVLTLNIQSIMTGPFGTTGRFLATGSYSAPGIDITLTGGGITTVDYVLGHSHDPVGTFLAPGEINYHFVAVPEPAMIFTTGLGLMALALWSRVRRKHRWN